MDHVCIQEERLRNLEKNQTETGVYYKIIREDIAEIKIDLKNQRDSPKNDVAKEAAKTWQPIVIKSLEIAGTAVALFAALKLAGK